MKKITLEIHEDKIILQHDNLPEPKIFEALMSAADALNGHGKMSYTDLNTITIDIR